MPKKIKTAETEEGTILFNVDPIMFKDHYEIDYIHSYAQDSPFFAGLAKGVILGSDCKQCSYKYATPRKHCMYCGNETEWFELPKEGKIHTWTTCFFGGQAFLKETPYHLIMVEFDGVNTLFMSRIIGVNQEDLEIGMKIKPRFLRNSKFKVTDVYFVQSDAK
ncbi:MAG: Zn-ribbon domain-containing OB-fold protein [Candidatus Anammoxibacter sp.]